jgi:hypothetical protein
MKRAVVGAIFAALLGGVAGSGEEPLPYRFLLVIGDQWKDPSGFVIGPQDDFQTLAALLTTWVGTPGWDVEFGDRLRACS